MVMFVFLNNQSFRIIRVLKFLFFFCYFDRLVTFLFFKELVNLLVNITGNLLGTIWEGKNSGQITLKILVSR